MELPREDSEDYTPVKSHQPLSPAAGAESLFLAGLATNKISANALASQLQHAYSSDRSSARSVGTDDWATAVENTDDLLLFSSDDEKTQTIPELDSDTDSDSDTVTRDIMSTMTSKVSTATPVDTKMPKKVPPSTSTSAAPAAEHHVDAATHVYEGAKGVWAWGKGVPVISFGLGVTEFVAGKVVGIAGSNLEEIDGGIAPQLANFDNGVLNPAIEKVVSIVLGAAGKTEEIVKPIILTILSPFGLLKNEAENPEVTK